MQLSKIEGLSAIVGLLLTFVAGASYIVVLRDDINDLEKDINDLKNQELTRNSSFEKLTEDLTSKIEKEISVLKKENRNLIFIKEKLEEKYINKRVIDVFTSQELLDNAINDFKNEKYRTSISKLEKIIEKSPNDAEALLYLSRSYSKSGNKEKALIFIKKAYKKKAMIQI